MTARAFLGAGLGAVLGAAIWAALAAGTGYEIGYIAWGIGLLVGGISRKLGGVGRQAGIVCATMALASMLGGKLLAVAVQAPAGIRQAMTEQLTEADYQEAMKDAEDFAKMTSADEYPSFIISHGYTEADDAGSVSTEELAEFTKETAPRLRELNAEKPEYLKWRDAETERVIPLVMGQISFLDLVVENLGVMDLVFALLGIVTAFKLCAQEGAQGGLPSAPVGG